MKSNAAQTVDFIAVNAVRKIVASGVKYAHFDEQSDALPLLRSTIWSWRRISCEYSGQR